MRSIARTSLAEAVRVAAFIVVVGPLIGTFLLMLQMGLVNSWGFGEADARNYVVEVAQSMVMFAVLGYLMGGLPALISALWLGWRTFLAGDFTRWSAIVTAMMAAFGFVVFSVVIQTPDGRTEWAPRLGDLTLLYLNFATVSVISAIICHSLLRLLGWIGTKPAEEFAKLH